MLPPPSFFRLWPSVHLCIIAHQCNASESKFKENLDFQDILIHQEASNFVNSLLPAHETSVNV